MEKQLMEAAYIQAAFCGHTEEILDLISKGVDVNYSNGIINAIGAAAQRGHVDCLVTLIEAKADINRGTIRGITALHRTCYTNRVGTLRILIRNGARLDTIANDETALQMAAGFGHIDCVKALVEAGADTLPTDQYGQNALLLAMRRERRECARYLYHVTPNRDCVLASRFVPPEFAKSIIDERRNTQNVTKKWMGILRKRVSLKDPSNRHIQGRLPRDVVTLLGRYLWATRLDEKWEMGIR